MYHYKSIAAEQLLITIVFQTKNKKFVHSTLLYSYSISNLLDIQLRFLNW